MPQQSAASASLASFEKGSNASVTPGGATVQFLGSGDAFGSGGRFQACILVTAAGNTVLLDCGASSLIAMKQAQVDAQTIDGVIVTHLHGDHFAGLPFLILDSQFSHRQRPLVIAGPRGLHARVQAAMEVLFPGSTSVGRRFAIEWHELEPLHAVTLAGFEVKAFEVVHASGAPALAIRLCANQTVIAYTGDTEWTDSLVDAASGSDLMICEAYAFDKAIRYHLSYQRLLEHLPAISAKRLILTHLGSDLLSHLDDVQLDVAFDGLALVIGGDSGGQSGPGSLPPAEG